MGEIKIYDYEKRVESLTGALSRSASISKRNKQIILDFIEWQDARGISRGRKYKNLFILRKLGLMTDKDFDCATMRDLQKLVAKINNLKLNRNGESVEASAWHKADLRTTLKLLIKWLKGDRYNPQDYAWLRTSLKQNEKKTRVEEGDVLSVEEVEKILKATTSTRDKALISVAYESAARPSEILSLRIANVTFDTYGAVINIQESKTRLRPIRLITSSAYVRGWLNIHPYRGDRTSPIWIASRSLQSKPAVLGVGMFAKLLRTNARRAGLQRRIYPYLLRHSRLTHLVQKYPDQIVKRISGHTPTSKHFEVYLHMSNKDVDDAVLRSNGLLRDEDERRKELEQPIRCWSCGTLNSIDAKICESCNFSLDFSSLGPVIMEIKKLGPIVHTLSKLQDRDDIQLSNLKRISNMQRVLRKRNSSKTVAQQRH